MLKEESKMNRIKVGIVGCGGIFRNLHAPYYEEPNRCADIVAVADLDTDSAVNRPNFLMPEHTLNIVNSMISQMLMLSMSVAIQRHILKLRWQPPPLVSIS